MGAADAVIAGAFASGAPVERSPDGDQRDLVPGPDGVPVAGPAGWVRELEERLRAASPLVAGRGVGEDPGPAAGAAGGGRRGGRGQRRAGERGPPRAPAPSPRAGGPPRPGRR